VKTVLVTGGAGYIGSHACKALSVAGYLPVAYDNMVNGHEWAVKWGPLEKGDIADSTRLGKVIAAYKPLAVMHFSAFAYVGESVEDPLKYYRNNVAGTLSLLEAMREHAVERMVFSSTCATYGVPEHLPISENHPQKPINPYGMSKLMVERLLKDCHVSHGLRSISLRYFNAAGADPEGDIGETHNPETHLIPLVLDTAMGKRPHITIFGDDYPTTDGTCLRDYIHVTDLAQAHVLALKELERSSQTTRESQRDLSLCKAYNLGNGLGFSVKDVIDVAEKVTGKSIPVKIGKRRPGDAPVLVGDSARIRKDLEWRPQYEELEIIIETAWKWAKRST
jgi:UDP-arabinose 4-epimerase